MFCGKINFGVCCVWDFLFCRLQSVLFVFFDYVGLEYVFVDVNGFDKNYDYGQGEYLLCCVGLVSLIYYCFNYYYVLVLCC